MLALVQATQTLKAFKEYPGKQLVAVVAEAQVLAPVPQFEQVTTEDIVD